jgi:hypothetical protein
MQPASLSQSRCWYLWNTSSGMELCNLIALMQLWLLNTWNVGWIRWVQVRVCSGEVSANQSKRLTSLSFNLMWYLGTLAGQFICRVDAPSYCFDDQKNVSFGVMHRLWLIMLIKDFISLEISYPTQHFRCGVVHHNWKESWGCDINCITYSHCVLHANISTCDACVIFRRMTLVSSCETDEPSAEPSWMGTSLRSASWRMARVREADI